MKRVSSRVAGEHRRYMGRHVHPHKVHKIRNVLAHLPKEQHDQVRAAMRAAWKLDAREGEQKLKQLARWLERDHPSAAASLREGLAEMVHDQPTRSACPAQEVPGHDEPHRQHPLGREAKDTASDELGKRSDGTPLGRRLVRRDREELPTNRRLRSALDAQSSPR